MRGTRARHTELDVGVRHTGAGVPVHMTSIARQDRRELGGALSVLHLQKRDHQRLEQLLRQVEGATSAPQEQRALRRTARLVFPHAFAEEAVLWPALRRGGHVEHELTLEVEREHQEVNELWSSLEELDPDDPRREPVLVRLVQVLRQDVRDEEDELLPRLQQMLAPHQLRVVGLAWELVRRTAPTRPHAVVARRPPGNALAALPLSAIDRLRDLLDAVGQAAPALQPRATRASASLAGLAGRVERFAPFRAGEHPSTSRS